MGIQHRLNVVLLLAALSCCIPAMASAEESPGWHGQKGEHDASLFYGIPQTDHALLSFSCTPGYPLDGAREAAAALIETCIGRAASAKAPEIAQCELSAWVMKGAPPDLPVRSGPGPDYPAVATIPRPYTDGEEIYFPQVTITGSRDGWFRISEVITDLYGGWPTDPVVTFSGEGWLPGNMLRVWLESPYLLSRPSHDAPIAFTVSTSSSTTDDFRLDTLHACEGSWVEVEGRRADERPRGWIMDICASQVTTCP